ncbi:hypothetical protein DICSQDRAFT_174889 [Dichomitus squalens LYAD-421 SS1]|uniref:Uncharacterized protein n=2 Tax=Dichomitus squalens TaxID=114155 RepID=A0A4Q9M5R0_9APHY|nr:uncharacterized protein DICSQDRAFT_174889 [Dichomitus squalens LYAD-421 SS1]EJF56439.1 hypothetical protein DICSQDRAFT_174889 [Dichomitus squalens LYAD-421 SS1]TBU21378.1 hypothetical protein BD311DRAFT_812370 [Dichomitus squalens]TBU53049.1 hypothetical protein BD310DRAFT_952344 [Dichomitus squalens]
MHGGKAADEGSRNRNSRVSDDDAKKETEEEVVPAIPRAAFLKLIEEIANDIDSAMHWKEEAILALQEGAEDSLAKLARRGTVEAEDMRIVRDVLTPIRVIHLDPAEKGISMPQFKRELNQPLVEMGYEDFTWRKDALKVLRNAAQDHIIEIFEKSGAMARQAGHATVGINDYRFSRFVMPRRKGD